MNPAWTPGSTDMHALWLASSKAVITVGLDDGWSSAGLRNNQLYICSVSNTEEVNQCYRHGFPDKRMDRKILADDGRWNRSVSSMNHVCHSSDNDKFWTVLNIECRHARYSTVWLGHWNVDDTMWIYGGCRFIGFLALTFNSFQRGSIGRQTAGTSKGIPENISELSVAVFQLSLLLAFLPPCLLQQFHQDQVDDRPHLWLHLIDQF